MDIDQEDDFVEFQCCVAVCPMNGSASSVNTPSNAQCHPSTPSNASPHPPIQYPTIHCAFPRTTSTNNPTVSWNWGSGHPGGVAAEVKEGDVSVVSNRGNKITKHGEEGNPAVHIERSGNDVVKKANELTVDKKGSGSNGTSSKSEEKKDDAEEEEDKDDEEEEEEEDKDDEKEAQAGDKRKADEKADKAGEKKTEAKKGEDAKKQKTANGTAKKANGEEKKKPGRPKAADGEKKEKKEKKPAKEKKVPATGQAARKTRSQGKAE